MTYHYTCLAKINSLKNRLERLQQVVLRDNPQLCESIPSPDGTDIKKLGNNGLIMIDSCNAAQKARCLLRYLVGGTVCELDCYHHLHNVWIKGLKKSVTVFLQVVVSDSLEQIPPELRVTCIFSAMNCKNRGRPGAKVASFPLCNHSIVRNWMS